MQLATINKTFTVAEYIQYEWTAQQRHEFINGQLFPDLSAYKIHKV